MDKRNTSTASTLGKPKTSKLTSAVGGRSKLASMTSQHGRLNTRSTKMDGRTADKQRQAVVVYDENGNDVTPRPLLPRSNKQGGDVSQGSTGSRATSVLVPQQSNASLTRSALKTPQSGSFFGLNQQQQRPRSSTSVSFAEDEEGSSMLSAESADEDEQTARQRKIKAADAQSSSSIASRVPKPKEIPDNYVVTLTLTESDTISMFDLPSYSIGADIAEEPNVIAANERYVQVKQAHLTSENYAGRGCQTFNNVVKSKDIQAVLYTQASVGVQATNWDIYDANAELVEEAEAKENAAKDGEGAVVPLGDARASGSIAGSFASNAGISNSLSQSMQNAVVATSSVSIDQPSAAESSMVSDASSNQGEAAPQSAATSAQSEKPTMEKLNQEKLLKTILKMEIAVMHNNHLRKLAAFYDQPDINPVAFEINKKPPAEELDPFERPKVRQDKKAADALGSTLPSLQLLWTFKCELTKGRPINFMAWNKKNPNILAIAYGEVKVSPQSKPKVAHSPGLILVWSLKNIEYPDRVYKTKSPVKSLDFSSMNPSLLAAGMNDGNIAIFDIRLLAGEAVLDTNGANQHHDPVWQVCWVELEQIVGEEESNAESLISVSTDGHIKEWSMKKGMEGTEIMSLKRSSKQPGKGQKAEEKGTSFVSRLSGGLCMDFNGADSKIYVVGTEEGVIHKCSKSYEGQYLDSYYGHSGPVYSIGWSPYVPSVFLSCGADWCVRLWKEENVEAVFKLQSGRVPVNDVTWSPHSATVLATAHDDGRIEVWDLAHSFLSPVILHTVLDHRLTRVLFAPKSPCLVAGDDNGAVTVYKLRNFKRSMCADVPREEQARLLTEVIAAKDKKPEEEAKKEEPHE